MKQISKHPPDEENIIKEESPKISKTQGREKKHTFGFFGLGQPRIGQIYFYFFKFVLQEELVKIRKGIAMNEIRIVSIKLTPKPQNSSL